MEILPYKAYGNKYPLCYSELFLQILRNWTLLKSCQYVSVSNKLLLCAGIRSKRPVRKWVKHSRKASWICEWRIGSGYVVE